MSNNTFSPHEVKNNKSIYKILIFILLAVGCFSRIFSYFSYSDMWFDELAIAYAVKTMNFWELITQTLPHLQSAPLGFMLVLEFFSQFGFNIYMLYLFPTLSGLALLFLAYKFMDEVFGHKQTILYLAFFVMSIALLFYSTELKQYMTEALISLILVYYFIRNKKELCETVSYKFLFMLIVMNLFSSTVPFVICGVAIAVLYNLGSIKNSIEYVKRNILKITLFCIFYFSYFSLYLKKTSIDGMQAYWEFAFLPLDAEKFIPWFKNVFLGATQYISYIPLYPGGYSLGGIFFFMFFLYGSYLLFVKNKDLFFCSVIPLVVVLIVSACKMYPFGDDGGTGSRLILFLYPLFLIPMAVSLTHLMHLIFRTEKLVIGALCFAVLISCSSNIFYAQYEKLKIQQTEQFVSYINNNISEDSQTFIYAFSELAYQVYTKGDLPEYKTFREENNIVQMVEKSLQTKSRAILLLSHYKKEYAASIIKNLKNLNFKVIQFQEAGAVMIIVYK